MDVTSANVMPFRAQGGVNVCGNRVRRFSSHAICADLVAHGDDVGVVSRRPSKAERVHFAEECVIGGIRDRNRSARNQGSANHHGDRQSGQPPT